MKEINGKIKFVAIPVNKDVKIIDYGKTNLLRSSDDVDFIANKVTISQIKTAVYLSEITEEQAAEFVEYDNARISSVSGVGYNIKAYHDYLSDNKFHKSAKESLISLLKANDVWIKEWVYNGNKTSLFELDERGHECSDVKTKWSVMKEEEYYLKFATIREFPDDLLIIKL